MNTIKKEKRAILGLSLGHFSIDLYAALLVPLYPIITTKLGINLASISAIIAFGHLVSSMMQPLFGFISDKLKHRVFMVWGLVFSACFIPLAVKAPNVALFLACLLLGMIGNAFFHPQVSALVKDFNKTTYATLTYAEYSNISKEDFAKEIIEQHKILKQFSKEKTFFDVPFSERFE